ncbi:unnamed protein product [Brassica oleracea var. botrytis]|uniref:Uncharacterized protein n=1 Tax=Brassica oleracea TaxID=3712 RepID=A0A3P6F8J5_BRAOL|nr:unnamed protein product [Brassica oleracea]
MLSFKTAAEFCEINCRSIVKTIALLPTRPPLLLRSDSTTFGMADNLHKAIRSMSLDDDDPITFPDEPQFRGLPGFRLLFPQLPPEESRMAIQYVSHANETKRKARILRVQQAIEVDKDNPPASLTKFSHELNKEKGHVFDYGRTVSDQDIEVVKRPTPTLSAPVFGRLSFPTEVSSGESSGAPSRHKNPMVFSMGASGSCFTGMPKSKKKERRRPPA